MATDLDRTYVINGDDLRIGLQRADIAHTDGLARWLLNFAGKPLDDSRWPMTRGELETRLSLALTAVNIFVRAGDDGKPVNPAALAEDLVADIDRQGTPATLAARIAAQEAECRAEGARCDRKGGPYTCPALDAPPGDGKPEHCPFHLGNGAPGECNCELKKYALVTPGTPDVRPIEDPELIAAQQILDALAPLEVADPAAVLRVLRWVGERFEL